VGGAARADMRRGGGGHTQDALKEVLKQQRRAMLLQEKAAAAAEVALWEQRQQERRQRQEERQQRRQQQQQPAATASAASMVVVKVEAGAAGLTDGAEASTESGAPSVHNTVLLTEMIHDLVAKVEAEAGTAAEVKVETEAETAHTSDEEDSENSESSEDESTATTAVMSWEPPPLPPPQLFDVGAAVYADDSKSGIYAAKVVCLSGWLSICPLALASGSLTLSRDLCCYH
jgi:hypothetical protein